MRTREEIQADIDAVEKELDELCDQRDYIIPIQYKEKRDVIYKRHEDLLKEYRDGGYIARVLIDSVGDEISLSDLIEQVKEQMVQKGLEVDFSKILINAETASYGPGDHSEYGYINVIYNPFPEED